jgi:hypothetical protein
MSHSVFCQSDPLRCFYVSSLCFTGIPPVPYLTSRILFALCLETFAHSHNFPHNAFRFMHCSVRHTATLLNSRISVVGLQFFMDKMGRCALQIHPALRLSASFSLDSTQFQPLSKPSHPSHSTCTPSEPEVPMPLNTIYCSSDSDCLRYSNKLNCTRITAQNREANVDRRFMNFDNIGAAGLVMLRDTLFRLSDLDSVLLISEHVYRRRC